jgi:hypothetical protein
MADQALASARERLIDDLQTSLGVYDEKPRHGVRLALLSVIRFLQDELEDTSGLPLPLCALLAALSDADNGVSNELIDRMPRQKGRTSMQLAKSGILVLAASRVTLMVSGFGARPAVAIEMVAKDLDLDKDRLREFLKNIRRGRASSDAQNFYWDIIRGVLPRLKNQG